MTTDPDHPDDKTEIEQRATDTLDRVHEEVRTTLDRHVGAATTAGGDDLASAAAWIRNNPPTPATTNDVTVTAGNLRWDDTAPAAPTPPGHAVMAPVTQRARTTGDVPENFDVTIRVTPYAVARILAAKYGEDTTRVPTLAAALDVVADHIEQTAFDTVADPTDAWLTAINNHMTIDPEGDTP